MSQLYLKLHILLHLLAHKRAQNDSMVTLNAYVMLHLKVQPKFPFREHLKIYKKMNLKEDVFDVAVDGLVDFVIEVATYGCT